MYFINVMSDPDNREMSISIVMQSNFESILSLLYNLDFYGIK